MTFSKEDHRAWESSEVMRELEKIAEDVLNGPPAEAYEPIEETWEEDKEECPCPKEETIYEQEIQAAYINTLFSNLEKISSHLAENSKVKAAYRIEKTLENLKAIFKEDKNG